VKYHDKPLHAAIPLAKKVFSAWHGGAYSPYLLALGARINKISETSGIGEQSLLGE
jgi:hypothetical protein